MGDEERVEEAPKKKGKGKLFLLLIILLVVLGIGGGAAYFFFFKKKAPAPQQAMPTQPAATPAATAPVATPGVPSAPQFFYKLDTFIVNLADEGGSRYLKVDMTLALSNKEVEKEIEKKLPLVRDAVITVISNKYYKDIATPAGKLALKKGAYGPDKCFTNYW